MEDELMTDNLGVEIAGREISAPEKKRLDWGQSCVRKAGKRCVCVGGKKPSRLTRSTELKIENTHTHTHTHTHAHAQAYIHKCFDSWERGAIMK